jgi:hypothetical protein
MDPLASLGVPVYDEEYEVPGAPEPAVIVAFDPMLLGVAGGRLVSTRGSDVKSSLFPTSIRLRFGDANARASFKKGCNASKEPCDVIS